MSQAPVRTRRRSAGAPKRRRPREEGSGSDAKRPTVLEARDVIKDYRSGSSTFRALDGVILSIAAGSFVSIMGPSGSGKSTLLHLLGGLDRPTSGEVYLKGKPLSGLSDKELTLARRTQIGFVFQSFNLVPVLSAAENASLGGVIAGDKPGAYASRLAKLLEACGIKDLSDKLPSELSGGQQQRVAIARALFMQPEIVLADEPTGNLDSKSGLSVIRLLKSAQRDLGRTVCMVTHDPKVASYADTIVFIADGRVLGTFDARANGGESRAKAVRAWLQELGA